MSEGKEDSKETVAGSEETGWGCGGKSGVKERGGEEDEEGEGGKGWWSVD